MSYLSRMSDEEKIQAVIRRMFPKNPTPIQICVCGEFSVGEFDLWRNRIKCRNCGGWMSEERMADGESGI